MKIKCYLNLKKFLASSPVAGTTQHASCGSVAASLHLHPPRLLFPHILQPPQFHRNHPIHPLLSYYTDRCSAPPS